MIEPFISIVPVSTAMSPFKFLACLLVLLFPWSVGFGQDRELTADFRHRPPEMVVEGQRFSGPLKEIIEEAAGKVGYKVNWRLAPFSRSLHGLKSGDVDIVPRTIRNEEREIFVSYLGPIAYQQKDIMFLVKKGKENIIREYEDLHDFTVGVKRKTAYFARFDKDPGINKRVTQGDDYVLARMFIGGRFDTVAILDRTAIESALAGYGFKDYAYADYQHVQRIGNYYGMSKRSPHSALFPALNKALAEMVATGRVGEIYVQYGLPAPEH